MFCLLRLRFRSLYPPETTVILPGREVPQQILILVFPSVGLHLGSVVSQPGTTFPLQEGRLLLQGLNVGAL